MSRSSHEPKLLATHCTHPERERLRRRMKKTERRLRNDFPYDRIAPSIPPAPLRSHSLVNEKMRILICHDTQDLQMPRYRRKARSWNPENRILIKRRVREIPLPSPPSPEDILADTHFLRPFEPTLSPPYGAKNEAFWGDTVGSTNLKYIPHAPEQDSSKSDISFIDMMTNSTAVNTVVPNSRKRIRDVSAELSENGARPTKRRRKLTENHRLQKSDTPPSFEIDGDLEYEIETILDSKIDRRRVVPLIYLVKWLGYDGTDEEKSWVIATELKNAQELVRDFHDAHPNKPGPNWGNIVRRLL